MTRNEPTGFDPALYDADFFTWTQRQAAALRTMPRGAAVDIEHVAGEIEDLGKRDLREVVSLLERLIEHLVKLDACPTFRDRTHWKREATLFQRSALAAFTPGMRQLLSMDDIWNGGRRLASFAIAEVGVAYPALDRCPFTLDTVLSREFEVDDALAILTAAREASSSPSAPPKDAAS